MTDPRTALEKAYQTIYGVPGLAWFAGDHGERFRRFLAAEAWTSAAEILVPFHHDKDGNPTTQMKWSINPGFASSFKIGGVKYENLQKTDGEYEGEWFFVARVFGSEARDKHQALALAAACLKAKDAGDGR